MIVFVKYISDGKTVGTKKEKRVRWTNQGSSSRGVIPKAKIKTIKMTFVIVLGNINKKTVYCKMCDG